MSDEYNIKKARGSINVDSAFLTQYSTHEGLLPSKSVDLPANSEPATSEPKVRPETPSELTHHNDFDDDDEDSDESKTSSTPPIQQSPVSKA
jgi:hypothetical protein